MKSKHPEKGRLKHPRRELVPGHIPIAKEYRKIPILSKGVTAGGLHTLETIRYVPKGTEASCLPANRKLIRVVQESREKDYSCKKPRPEGGYFLWIGDPDSDRPLLSQVQVELLVQHLQHWLDTGSLYEDNAETLLTESE